MIRMIRVFRSRPRLSSAFILGLIVFMLLQWVSLKLSTRLVLSWDTAMGLYLVMAVRLIYNCPQERMQKRALELHENEHIILIFSVVSAFLSLVAIVLELASAKSSKGVEEALHIGLTLITLLGSWAFIHTAFAFNYAHAYYDGLVNKDDPGLDFPGKGLPLYVDFLYFSAIIGTSGQTADIALTNSAMRKVGLIHCVLAYLFNATILAMMINIAAGLL